MYVMRISFDSQLFSQVNSLKEEQEEDQKMKMDHVQQLQIKALS